MMVAVYLEQRFFSTPDGRVWTDSVFTRSFWRRYLSIFDGVRVAARVCRVGEAEPAWDRCDGEGVEFSSLPHYVGPLEFVKVRRQVVKRAREAMSRDAAVILRVPSVIASCVTASLTGQSRPYGVEVVGDPVDVFAPGGVQHPLRPFFRWWFARSMQRQVAGACACAYTSEQALQRRYPPPPGAHSTHYSSLELDESAIVTKPRIFRAGSAEPPALVAVGSMEQLYKGFDVLIDAVKLGRGRGLDVRLVLVGDGRHRPELQSRAARAGLNPHVVFRGQLPPGRAVAEELDRADLFVLPSRTEGLPRAMIEAMARGLPCIGSAVGGIGELLHRDDLVPAGDVDALAAKICEVLGSTARMTEMSRRNLNKAREYRDDVLQARRAAYYRHLRDATELWRSRGARS